MQSLGIQFLILIPNSENGFTTSPILPYVVRVYPNLATACNLRKCDASEHLHCRAQEVHVPQTYEWLKEKSHPRSEDCDKECPYRW